MKKLFFLLIVCAFCVMSCSDDVKPAQKATAESTVPPAGQFPKGAKIDLDIAGFEFAKMISPDLFLYMRNGASDLSATVEASGMELGVISTQEIFHNEPFENRKTYLLFKQDQMKADQGAGAMVMWQEKKDTVINGHAAAILSYSISGKKRGAVVFSALIDNGPQTVLFYSIDYENGKYLDKFKKTLNSLSFN